MQGNSCRSTLVWSFTFLIHGMFLVPNLHCLSGPFRYLSLWSSGLSQWLYEVPGGYVSWIRARIISELNNNKIWNLVNWHGFYYIESCCCALATYGDVLTGRGFIFSFLRFLLSSSSFRWKTKFLSVIYLSNLSRCAYCLHRLYYPWKSICSFDQERLFLTVESAIVNI